MRFLSEGHLWRRKIQRLLRSAGRRFIRTQRGEKMGSVKIKICGLKRPEDVRWVNEAKADYAGFVLFYPKSRRNISMEKAKYLLSLLSESVCSVAVVVSPTKEQTNAIEAAGFDRIQIHGKVDAEILEQVKIPVFRAVNISEEKVRLEDCDSIVGYVYDSKEPGSGKTFDWSRICKSGKNKRQLILAGGLNCENVLAGIDMVRPDIVDVSSGVETGYVKDRDKIMAFVGTVRKDR